MISVQEEGEGSVAAFFSETKDRNLRGAVTACEAAIFFKANYHVLGRRNCFPPVFSAALAQAKLHS